MNLSARAKSVLALLVLLGLAAYLVIVDLGVNAGRIHYGVSIEGVDVGGRTVPEAVELLDERGRELRNEAVVFEAGPFTRSFLPTELRWRPNSIATARQALEVGRGGGAFEALRQRIRAWLGGVRVRWRGKTRARKVTRLIDRWEKEALELGLRVDRPILRYRIRRAIVTWPRRTFDLPAASSS